MFPLETSNVGGGKFLAQVQGVKLVRMQSNLENAKGLKHKVCLEIEVEDLRVSIKVLGCRLGGLRGQGSYFYVKNKVWIC